MRKPVTARGAESVVGIALAGGGPLGGFYEIGALEALGDAIKGRALTECDVYVGVSAGAFFAAGLANGITPRAMHAMFIRGEDGPGEHFAPSVLLRPALSEFWARVARMPALMQSAAFAYFGYPPMPGAGKGLLESMIRLTRGLPNGVFDNGAVAGYLARLFGEPGRTNDFRKLQARLYIVATELDTGKAAPFGAPGLDHVPISEAVKASAALPGLYPPATIEGRDYVDGALKKTLHASVALRAGAKLLICINPLVPYDADLARKSGAEPVRLAERGLVTVLSQTFRALIHSRMRVGMERYATEFPDADVLLFEPAQDDPVMFFANMFSYADRERVAEHAYQHTMEQLRRRADVLETVLARHGLTLDRAALKRPRPKAASRRRGDRLPRGIEPLARTLETLEKTLSRTE